LAEEKSADITYTPGDGREETYKQALRGLFTAGTSAFLPRKNKGKGRWQTRIEICYHRQIVLNNLRGAINRER